MKKGVAGCWAYSPNSPHSTRGRARPPVQYLWSVFPQPLFPLTRKIERGCVEQRRASNDQRQHQPACQSRPVSNAGQTSPNTTRKQAASNRTRSAPKVNQRNEKIKNNDCIDRRGKEGLARTGKRVVRCGARLNNAKQ